MREADEPRLSLEVAGETVGQRLDAAIARGTVVRRADGRLSLPAADGGAGPTGEPGSERGYMYKRGPVRLPCTFLNHFLFRQAYGNATVPFGCRNCYKIKASTKSLRALVAMKDIAETSGFATKSGAQVDSPQNPDVYVTYVYLTSLDDARKTYAQLRPQVDGHAHLGANVALNIRRGCSNYEHHCGSPQAYTFDPRLEAVEAYLAERFVEERPPKRHSREEVNAMRLLHLVRTAYRIGDETYKDFTGGKPLYPQRFSYPPNEAAGEDIREDRQPGRQD